MGKRLTHSMTPGQVKTALQLVRPLSAMLELTQTILEAHHPAGYDADDCPVCRAHAAQMLALLDEWQSAQAQAQEHWGDGF